MTYSQIRESEEYGSLLRGVLLEPDADLPRLVFADFLEEGGEDVWAAFIRVQCELAGGGFATPAGRRLVASERELVARLDPLITCAAMPFTAGFGVLGSTPIAWGYATFRRGFVETVHSRAGDYFGGGRAPAVAGRWPVTQWFIDGFDVYETGLRPDGELRAVVMRGPGVRVRFDAGEWPHIRRYGTHEFAARALADLARQGAGQPRILPGVTVGPA